MNLHAAFKPLPTLCSGSVAVCVAVSALGLSPGASAGAKVTTFEPARPAAASVNGVGDSGSMAATPSTKNGYKTLYRFTGGSDGSGPFDTVLYNSGNLYGTTIHGGTDGDGTVFELTPDGTETVLYNFTGGSDGEQPQSFPHLIMIKGNLYGTASAGGALGQGTVFKLAPDGTLTPLYAFKGGDDGATPYSGVIMDENHNFYGTTGAGGGTGCGGSGCGTVWKLKPDGTEKVLHSFGTGTDGQVPYTGLLRDSRGNLYGTTLSGGASGVGTVFEVKADGSEKVLYSFLDGSDGAAPYGYLIEDSAGNLYGTTYDGGIDAHGTVFELAPHGKTYTETVLYAFQGGLTDGTFPGGGLIMDAQGNLYGTTENGGGTGCGGIGCGSVFELRPPAQKSKHWTEKVLQFFAGIPDGARPYEGVTMDATGELYGTTFSGGDAGCYDDLGCGTVYKLKQ